jgi:hypothetical protein
VKSTQQTSVQIRLLAAAVGAGAVVAGGALSLAYGEQTGSQIVVSDPTPSMTTGETSTVPSEAGTTAPVATPDITTTPTSAEPG